MENKVVYLLRHLGTIQEKESRSRSYTSAIKDAEIYFGISIYQKPFNQREMANNVGNRYFFRFPRYTRDGKKATRIGESVLLGVELTYGPFGDIFSPDPIYAFPSILFSKKGFITKSEIRDYEESKPYGQRTIEFFDDYLSACWISETYVEAAWKIAKVLYGDQNLFNAANFLKSSQEKFYVWPGQLSEVIGDNSTAQAGWEQVRLEDALINAYKTVEAVIGDIPKEDKKYFQKLKEIGVNPHELVGYSQKKEVHSVIRKINMERDKKAAHGKIPNRKITIGDLLEYQVCARFILLSAIEFSLGNCIY